MFLEQNNAFYNYQFGFRNKHSANHALTEITEHIWNACDKNLFTCRVYLDLQKLFHTLKHEILLSILKHYGNKELRIIGLSRVSLKECNIFWSKKVNHLWKQYLIVYHKALCLDLLSSSPITCTIQLNIVKYITMRITQTCY